MRLINYIKHKIMAFVDIFKDENDIDEKNVVGFISFAVMVLTMLVDIVSGFFGHNLYVQEFVYNSFIIENGYSSKIIPNIISSLADSSL